MRTKELLLILIICLAASPILGQNQRSVSLIEFELGVGAKASPNVSVIDFNSFSAVKSDKTNIGAALFMEARVNIPSTAFDVGLQFSLHFFDREWEGMMNRTYRFKSLTTYIDYNYRKWDNIVPFAGVGVGFSNVDLEVDYAAPAANDVSNTNSACLNPRIGVEIYDRVRLTLDWKIMHKHFSQVGLSLGFVFGGGKR